MVLWGGVAALAALTGSALSAQAAFGEAAKAGGSFVADVFRGAIGAPQTTRHVQKFTREAAISPGVSRAAEAGGKAEIAHYQGIMDSSYRQMMAAGEKGDIWGAGGAFATGAAASIPGLARIVYRKGGNVNIQATTKKLQQQGYSFSDARSMAKGAADVYHAGQSGALAGGLMVEGGANLIGAGLISAGMKGVSIAKVPLKTAAKQIIIATAPAGAYEGVLQDLIGQRAFTKVAKGKVHKIDPLRTVASGAIGATVATAAGLGFGAVGKYAPKFIAQPFEAIGSTILDPLEKPGDIITSAAARATKRGARFHLPIVTPVPTSTQAPESIYTKIKPPKGDVSAFGGGVYTGSTITGTPTNVPTHVFGLPIDTPTDTPAEVPAEVPAETDVPPPVDVAVSTNVPVTIPVPVPQKAMPLVMPPMFPGSVGKTGYVKKGNLIYFSEIGAARRTFRSLL